jgi:CRISPR-associated endoribonuclease Cas6
VNDVVMRLIVRLQAVENMPYEMQYHYHLQGFIYSLLRGSVYYDDIHDKEGYKLFCFSNIFPAKDLEKNDVRTLIISSPDPEFIRYLHEILIVRLNRLNELKIGTMKFNVDSMQELATRTPDNSSFSLITGTPIIVRIPKEKYTAYDPELITKYDYVYWRIEHPTHLFINQLQDNIWKKYIQYHQERYVRYGETSAQNYNNKPIFSDFRFKRQISTRLLINGYSQIVIGTVCEFVLSSNGNNKDIIEFAIDSGLGERNSLGFGFMNLIIKKDIYKESTLSEGNHI